MNPLATIARPAGRKACRRLPGVSHAGRVIAPTGSAMIASREAKRAPALAIFMFALAGADVAQTPYPVVCSFSTAPARVFPGGVAIRELRGLADGLIRQIVL